MRAAQMQGYGGPDVVTVTGDAARPTPSGGQLLVAVRAASLNPIDRVIRTGGMQKMLPLQFPATPGGDFAGIVAEVGPGVADTFAVGDEVYGQASALMGGSGTLAEFVAARAAMTAARPKTVDFIAAASLPLVGASAVQAITEHLNVQRGQRILIHGAAGGIGSIAVQIARHRGAYVIGTALTEDVDFVKSLCADEVIDGRQAFEEVVHDVDGVFDTVGGAIATKSYGVLKRGGVLVSMTAQPDEARMAETGVRAIAQLTQPTTARLTTLAALVDVGVVTPRVDRVFPLDEAAAAFAFNESGRAHGKVVVEIRGRPA